MPDENYTFPNKHRARVSTRTHIELIKTIRDRDHEKLNAWERNFLISIVNYDSPSLRQLESVKTIVAKALTKGSQRRAPRRKRRAGR